MIQDGVLTGLSVEFYPEEFEERDNLIDIKRAVLSGVGLVDRAAYPKSKAFLRNKTRKYWRFG